MFNFLKSNKGKDINVNEIDKLIGNIDLIDIREPYEYDSGTIEGAKNIPMGTLLNSPDKYLKKDKEYYIMCRSGARSSRACGELIDKGYDVVNVSGGVSSYSGNKRK